MIPTRGPPNPKDPPVSFGVAPSRRVGQGIEDRRPKKPEYSTAASVKSQEVEVVFEAKSGGKSPDRRSNAAVRSSTTFAIHANSNSMEVRSDPIESAKSHFFDTSNWSEFCDVTLTLKQGHQPDSGGWVKIDDYRCRQAFRHFMNLLNRAVYGAAFRRYGKRVRVLPVLEKAKFAHAPCVHGSVARPVDGIFIVQLNCPRTSMLLPLKT